MLPTNVMSFMKKMVTTNEGSAPGSEGPDSGTALSKLRQTLSSSLMNAQDKVTKLGPTRQTPAADAVATPTEEQKTPLETPIAKPQKPDPAKPICRTGTCRVCLKSFKPEDFFRTCCECQQKVCEDCASYSKLDENQDESTWRCSICRRKMQSRNQPVIAQDSTDSLLELPVLEALQRRHSDVKIGSGGITSLTVGNAGGNLGVGLAPPRSPELRRHSDVSPVSLKELEKVAGERREELRWERELEWRQHKRGGASPGRSRATSPDTERRQFLENQSNSRRPSAIPVSPSDNVDPDEEWKRHRAHAARRKSHVTRQRSYDEELKNDGSAGNAAPSGDAGGLGLPVQLPRRASAYDVYAAKGDGAAMSPAAMMAAVAAASRGQQPSYTDDSNQATIQVANTGRRPSRYGNGEPEPDGSNPATIQVANTGRRPSRYGNGEPEGDGSNQATIQVANTGRRPSRYGNGEAEGEGSNPASIQVATTGRRPSFRAIKTGDGEQLQAGFDGSSTSPLSPEGGNASPALGVEDDRRQRRRGSALPDMGNRALPATPPITGRPAAVAPRALEELNDAPRRQASVDGEAIKIVIHDVDSDINFNSRPGPKRRVILRRDPSDKAHRTRGFGMRVVGGKTGHDGRLFAYIVWTVPGGPAEKGGLQQGDKVLEWDGLSLVDRSFEEVCAVMDRTGEVAEILVEHATDLRMCDLLEDQCALGLGPRKSGDSLAMDPEDKTPLSPTRRKLPKTPEQLAREKMVSGRVQLQVFYHDAKKELVVSVMAADDLAVREDTGFGTLPEAYAKLRLLPNTGEQASKKSAVAEPSQNPVWNATIDFPNVRGEELMDKTIEVTLWDYCPDRESVFLGEATVELQKAFVDNHPVWYRLEDPRQMRGAKTPHASPRGSLANDMAQRMIRRSDFGIQRSFSDDRTSEDGPASPELNMLHPDHAWMVGSGAGSRRGSSQSEQLEVEQYQLTRDFSRSLPGSRRSSLLSGQNPENKDGDIPPVNYNKERRRSSATRGSRDPDEILKSLKAVKGELLGRTMSLTGADPRLYRRSSEDDMSSPQRVRMPLKTNPHRSYSRDAILPRQPPVYRDQHWSLCNDEMPGKKQLRFSRDPARKERKFSVLELPEKYTIGYVSPTEDEDRWRNVAVTDEGLALGDVQLGPGQIHPRGYRLFSSKQGSVKLGLLMTKGQLEVEVMCARNIACEARESLPDTYVKTYLRDGERWLQKRKTRVVRHSGEPVYQQTLRYSACDVLGRSLLVMLWERQKGFEHNQGLGGAEVALDKIQLTHVTTGWYPLFPLHSLGSDTNESP